MKKTLLLWVVLVPLFFSGLSANGTSELYIITARDGSVIVVRDYRFTDEYVEFTTENGLPGFIKRTEFVRIENMVGVQPGRQTTAETREEVNIKQHLENYWLVGAGGFVFLCTALIIYLLLKKKRGGQGGRKLPPGRKKLQPKSQGHLSFEYTGTLGNISRWTIEVQRAYGDKGVLYVEGICTTTGKRKKFRANRVAGPVTDLSSGQQASMHHFFTEQEDGSNS